MLDCPPDWARAIRLLLEGPARRAAVLGPADAGKSSFCRLVLAQGAAAGLPIALLDADPAQKMVGPPACVTLGCPGGGGEPELAALAFLGAVDPLHGWTRLLSGVARLAEGAGESLLLANTSGLLRGAGRRLNAAMLQALGAGLILAIGSDPGLEAILGDHPALPVLRLAPSPLARRKTVGERRALRQAGFRRHFAGATRWRVDARELWLEEMPGAPRSWPPGLLLGLAGADGRDLGLGLLGEREPAGGLTILSPVGRAEVAGLRCGRLSLDSEFRDHPLRP